MQQAVAANSIAVVIYYHRAGQRSSAISTWHLAFGSAGVAEGFHLEQD